MKNFGIVNRAKFKDILREKSKSNAPTAYLDYGVMSSKRVAECLGIVDKVALLNAWYDAKEKEIEKKYEANVEKEKKEIAKRILASTCVALNITWGYKGAIRKYLQNIDEAMKRVEEMGIEKTLDMIFDQCGIDCNNILENMSYIEKAKE